MPNTTFDSDAQWEDLQTQVNQKVYVEGDVSATDALIMLGEALAVAAAFKGERDATRRRARLLGNDSTGGDGVLRLLEERRDDISASIRFSALHYLRSGQPGVAEELEQLVEKFDDLLGPS